MSSKTKVYELSEQIPAFTAGISDMDPIQIAKYEYVQDFYKYRHVVVANWIMFGIAALAEVSLISLYVYGYRTVLECGFERSPSICQSTTAWIIAIFLMIFFAALMFLHYRTIAAYRKVNAGSMGCVFICYSFFFGLSISIFSSVGVIIYGYLAYTTYNLKTKLAHINHFFPHQELQELISPLSSQSSQGNETNPTRLKAALRDSEREIDKYRFTVPLNWTMITVTVLFGIVLSMKNVDFDFLFHCNDDLWRKNSFCTRFLGVWIGEEFLVLCLSIPICILIISLHYSSLDSYNKRRVQYTAWTFICFCFLFDLSILWLNPVGGVIYGYLAYSTYKLKTAFDKFNKLDEHISRPEMENNPIDQYQPDHQI